LEEKNKPSFWFVKDWSFDLGRLCSCIKH